jgi:hypothetical protein
MKGKQQQQCHSSQDIHIPDEVLVRISQFFTLQQRSRAACISRAWRSAACVDAANTQLEPRGTAKGSGSGSSSSSSSGLYHLDLHSEQQQAHAAASPIVALSRSATLSLSSATGELLDRTTRLQQLRLSASDPALLLGFPPLPLAAVPELDLHLVDPDSCDSPAAGSSGSSSTSPTTTPRGTSSFTSSVGRGQSPNGDKRSLWTADVLSELAQYMAATGGGGGDEARELQSLSLRCDGGAMFADAGAALAPLGALSGLRKLSLGPVSPPSSSSSCGVASCSPPRPAAGFGRVPEFLDRLGRLSDVELTLSDSPAAPISAAIFDGAVARAAAAALELRADGPRAVGRLPAGVAAVTGLARLVVHSFCFEVGAAALDDSRWLHKCGVAP